MDLEALVTRLQKAPNPVLAQQAVLGIFHLISQKDQLHLPTLRCSLDPCLSHWNKASSRSCFSSLPTSAFVPLCHLISLKCYGHTLTGCGQRGCGSSTHPFISWWATKNTSPSLEAMWILM